MTTKNQALAPMLEAGELTANDLLKAGQILHRYERVCELASRSY